MDPFVAEIRIFAGNFPPLGWALCNGQLLPISQNTALFSLLGTTYGGDGKTNFALPNLQGCAPMHPGQGPGLSDHVLGETGGQTTVTLLPSQMPAHAHSPVGSATAGTTGSPANAVWSAAGRGRPPFYAAGAPNVSLSPSAVGAAGGNQPHNNMSPYLGLTFIIALQGVFPPRG
jgi:microcystin-dependent protein